MTESPFDPNTRAEDNDTPPATVPYPVDDATYEWITTAVED